ncbi:MAG: recombinase family protein [Clostridia bacterium]|nr:recombinase family protein [Clostridia bacterium]
MDNCILRAAVYCRLSREDDDDKDESQSIQYQKEVLTEYVQKQGWILVDTYDDDGYSGTNFDRPNFQRLLNDIELGRIDIVITKDLSRLGRNYIQTGYYTEDYFPNHNVRYIALNDNFDTSNEDGNEFAPFRNIINEWYARDISKKVRFTLDNMAKNGEPRNTVFPIFGYTYNSAFERIPDSETAPIVQLIYRKYVEWGSSVKVARYLKEQKIKIPRYYNAIKYNYNKKKVLEMSEDELTNWRPDGIREIIEREEYLGVYKTSQSKSKSYKNKKRSDNKDCYIFKDRYEPLIDKETWEIANKIRTRTRSGSIPMEENIFKGLIFCADCGHLMRFERRKNFAKSVDRPYDYRHFCPNKKCEHSNSIPKHCVIFAVKQDLMDLKNLILSKEKEFLDFAKSYDSKGRLVKTDTNVELNKHIKRTNEIDMFIQKLFEQSAKGVIPTSTFDMMMSKYKKEREALEDDIRLLTRKQQEEMIKPQNFERASILLENLKEFNEENLMQPEVIQKLIKKIVIKSNRINNSPKNKEYEITIVYFQCDELIKEFKTYEKPCGNLC